MMMVNRFLIFLFIVIFPFSVVYADFKLKFTNYCKITRIIYFNWQDHPYGSLRRANLITAELKPGESYSSQIYRKPGIYEIYFSDFRSKDKRGILLRIEEDVTFIEFQDTDKGTIHIIKEINNGQRKNGKRRDLSLVR